MAKELTLQQKVAVFCEEFTSNTATLDCTKDCPFHASHFKDNLARCSGAALRDHTSEVKRILVENTSKE